MSHEACQTELQERSKQLLDGPLKHIRAAALAAALLPLASVAATPAAAQTCEPSFSAGSVCGFVWTDTDRDGIQDSGELGIPGVTVTLGTTTIYTTTTDSSGFYYFYDVALNSPQVVSVEIPDGMDASTPNAGSDDTIDSDGTPNGTNSVGSAEECEVCDIDFGFTPEVDAGGVVPSPCDFITSGGFVINDAGKKVTFGIHGGCKNGEFWGHLNVVDHSNGYHINSTEITGYVIPSSAAPTTREICGLARTNNPADPEVAFRVRLTDNGEPGSLDLFGIRLSTGYHISPRLLSALKPGGGNIQLHDPNPSTTAPEAPPQCWGLASPQ